MFGQSLKTKAQHQGSNTINFKKIPYGNPFSLFSRFVNEYDHLYFLESVEGPKKLTEFSFIGFSPRKVIRVKNGKTTIFEGKDEYDIEVSNPLDAIEKELNTNKIQNSKFRLIGGAVGYVSYDSIRYWEKLTESASDDLQFPDIEMGIYDDGIVLDHINKKAYYYYSSDNRYDEVIKCLQKSSATSENLEFYEPRSNTKKKDFEESVRKAKKYIYDGDIFQVVLSKRYGFQFRGDLLNFYKALRRINPSPYMYYLKFGERQIIGSSPEMLVRVDRNQVETYPIAGTRPRVDDQKRNLELAEELLSDPKERAEHVMLVDLARNDVGRVSEYGTVSVSDLMKVHQFSHVQHIVSRVIGKISSNNSCLDALRVMLPAGTVSGAPKVRAMEIIEELEPTRRGPYAGAVGYFSFNGNADFAITIRTLVATGNRAYIQVGAGIVADSDPEREWFETESKAEALMKALGQAGEKL